ncbi:MAG: hypothetical protein QM791_18705 [Ferruginibacter sp.]
MRQELIHTTSTMMMKDKLSLQAGYCFIVPVKVMSPVGNENSNKHTRPCYVCT